MKRILLTRQDNSVLAKILKSDGYLVIDMPLIECTCSVDAGERADVFAELGSYDWLTFSSPNAVKGFFKAFFDEFDDIRSLGIVRLACVGEATARELAKFYLKADVIPEKQTASALVGAMHTFESLENLKILSVHGNLALPDLVKGLNKKNAIVDTFEVYQTTLVELSEKNKSVKDFKENGADVVVFSSPSAVESFVRNAKKLTLKDGAKRPKIVAIGTTTADAILKHSMTVSAVSESPKAEDIANSIKSLLA